MKEFIKDCKDLWVHSCQFTKKHWKGVLVMNVALCTAELLYYKYKSEHMIKFVDLSNDEESE